jgi:UDP-N-acetylmuramoyl-tripeptide--D-alanyl-D-alanine ligase
VKEFGAGALHFERIEDLLEALQAELGTDCTVLVKGSRFMRMERVVKYLVSGEMEAAGAASAQH